MYIIIDFILPFYFNLGSFDELTSQVTTNIYFMYINQLLQSL